MKKVSVSVIIPCYKCHETIEFAVASIWNQTRLPNEVILVEDYSNDNLKTIKALKKIEGKYPKNWVKVILLQENKGPGNARNIGWRKSKSKYIAFLDSDDSWGVKKIEIQFDFMEKEKLKITCHLTEKKKKRELLEENNEKIEILKKSLTFKSLLFKNEIATRSVMCVKDIRSRFDPDKYYAEDYLLWLNICKEINCGIILLEEKLAYYYDNNNFSNLSSNLLKMEKGVQEVYKILFNQNKLTYVEYLFLKYYSLFKFVFRVIKRL